MSQIIIDQITVHLDGACYNKLTHRERAIADFLLGIDALVLNGNKLNKRR